MDHIVFCTVNGPDGKRFKFSFDRTLSTTGDPPAVYLLFAYARYSFIIRKSGVDIGELKKNGGTGSSGRACTG